MAGTPSPPPPPSPPAPAGTVSCPQCGAPATAGMKFCAQCGASLTPATIVTAAGAPVASQPNVDLREKVDDDRGILKRLQMLIPGFRGYRQGEDLRASDALLRMQVADRIKRATSTIMDARTSLTNAGQFGSLNDLAGVISDLQRLEGEVRHAEQGYTGISPSIRIRPEAQDNLYEYDFGFVQAADQLGAAVEPLRQVTTADPAAVRQTVSNVQGMVRALDNAFRARIRSAEGIQLA